MTTQTPIASRQIAARETSAGDVLVINHNGIDYQWTIYRRGLSQDSGHSAGFPARVMLRQEWQRIDIRVGQDVASVVLASCPK